MGPVGDGGLAMSRTVWIISLLLLLFAGGCQALKPDPAAEATTRAIYDDLRHGQNESLQSRLPPKLRNPLALSQILRLRSAIPPGEPRSSRVVASGRAAQNDGSAFETVSIEYEYPGQATLLSVVLTQAPGKGDWQAVKVDLHAATDAELARNGFGLADKSPVQLGFLAYAILSPLMMLFAVIKVAATPNLRNKWLWVVASVIGVFGLRMDWATGVLAINWVSVQVIGAYVGSGPSRFDPWTIAATFPIGALLILGGLWANPRLPRRPAAKPD